MKIISLSSYQLMVRVLKEQCVVEEDPEAGTKKVSVKPNKEVSSFSFVHSEPSHFLRNHQILKSLRLFR